MVYEEQEDFTSIRFVESMTKISQNFKTHFRDFVQSWKQ